MRTQVGVVVMFRLPLTPDFKRLAEEFLLAEKRWSENISNQVCKWETGM